MSWFIAIASSPIWHASCIYRHWRNVLLKQVRDVLLLTFKLSGHFWEKNIPFVYSDWKYRGFPLKATKTLILFSPFFLRPLLLPWKIFYLESQFFWRSSHLYSIWYKSERDQLKYEKLVKKKISGMFSENSNDFPAKTVRKMRFVMQHMLPVNLSWSRYFMLLPHPTRCWRASGSRRGKHLRMCAWLKGWPWV